MSIEAETRALFDCAPVAMLVVDRAGVIQTYNRRAVELWGRAPRADEPSAQYLGGAVETGPSGQPDFLAEVARTGEGFQNRKLALRRADGARLVVRAHASPIRDDSGGVAGALATFDDITEFERAEAALRESEDRYRHLVETSPYGIVVHRDDRLIFCNTPALLIYRARSLDDLRGRSVVGMVHPDDQARVAARIRSVVERHAHPPVAEVRMIALDGSEITVEAVGRSVLFEGRPAVQTVLRDVSDARRARDALAQSEARLAAVIQHAPNVAMQWYERDGRIRMWNPASAEMFGFTAEEALGKRLVDLIHSDREHEQFLAAIEIVAATGTPLGPSEWSFKRRNGEEGTCWSTLFRIPGQTGADLFVCMDVDISERKRAEESLRAAESRYRAILESSVDGIIVIDGRGRVCEFNRAAEVMAGRPRQLVLGHSLGELIRAAHEDDARGVELARFLASGAGAPANQRVEMRIDRAGEPLAVEVSVSPVLGADQGLWAVVLRDLTERRRLEEQVRESQKLQAIGQLAGGIAHDFNNVLTSILGNAELALVALQTAPDVPPSVPENLRQIERSAQRAADMTRQLLAFGRRQLTRPQLLDLNTLLRDLETMLVRLLRENILIDWRLADELPAISADAGQLQQVVVNLVVNARDAMPDGGTLVIDTARVVLDAEYCARRAGARPGEQVRLRVTDTGCGMERATLERAFEPFFTTKPVGRGTGLGLSTVYGIVQQAGGHIDVQSEPGRGTTFEIFIPAQEGKVAPAQAAQAAPPVRSGSETILVCEDDRSLRAIMDMMLAGSGYTILVAGDAEQALALAARHAGPVHLLVTDIVMPGMNGRQLAETLTARRPGMRTLYVSGHSADTISHRGVLNRGIEYLEKPFTRGQLLSKIRQILDRPAPPAGGG